MGTYKVIQDIEAEDKLFGPLTLKQFIFACFMILFGYLCFWSIYNELWFLIIFFAPPALFFGVLAVPYGKDQPTEVWLMAKFRFFFRPRKRIWDQDGIKELVTITVPKHEEVHYTDGLSNTEVRSRLRALADTIDSRGWSVKGSNVNLNMPQAGQATIATDRLYQPATQVQESIASDVKASDDMYDQSNSLTAQHFDKMIQQSEAAHRDEILEKINSARQHVETEPQGSPQNTAPQTQASQQQNDYWFMRQSAPPAQKNQAAFGATPVVTPGQQSSQTATNSGMSKEEEQKILDKIHENKNRPNPMNSHLKTIAPLSDKNSSQAQATQPKQDNIDTSTAAPTTTKPQEKDTHKADTSDKSSSNQPSNPDILQYANNNDLSVETIARQANKKKPGDQEPDEVVVSLH